MAKENYIAETFKIDELLDSLTFSIRDQLARLTARTASALVERDESRELLKAKEEQIAALASQVERQEKELAAAQAVLLAARACFRQGNRRGMTEWLVNSYAVAQAEKDHEAREQKGKK